MNLMDVVSALHPVKQERIELERHEKEKERGERRVWQRRCELLLNQVLCFECRELMRDAYSYGTHQEKLYWQPDGCAFCQRYQACMLQPEELEDSDYESDDMAISSDEEESKYSDVEESKDSDQEPLLPEKVM